MAGGPVVVKGGDRDKVKCLIDALSEMQQYSAGEERGAHPPKDFFTLAIQLEYFAIGLRAFLGGAAIIFFMLPVSVSAALGYIPLFGGATLLYDKVYMFVLTFGIYSGGLLLILYSRKYIKGDYTKQIAQYMFSGAVFAAIAKGILFFVVYQLIQILITGEMVLRFLDIFRIKSLQANFIVQNILLNYKMIFRISSTIILLFSLASVLLIVITYALGMRQYRYYEKIRKEYLNEA